MQSTEQKDKGRGGRRVARHIAIGVAAVAVGLLVLWLCCLPRQLFGDVSYSTVVVDRNGRLLGARVADDGQWRFPPTTELPEKYATAIVQYEDRRFYSHHGVSLPAVARALWQNVSSGHVVSGGSTITMQTIRLHRRRARTLPEKVVEMFMATRLEWRYSKSEILALYASHAPFGGNVVGLRAAMWRYFGTDGTDLSWAEAATLAVLQNAPSQIHLTKNRDALLAKRNALLTRLLEQDIISQADYDLALDEPLIGEPYAMPQHAPHLVEHYNTVRHGKHTATEIDLALQQRVSTLLDHWSQELRHKGCNDLAAVIIDVAIQQPVAYVGNSDAAFEREGRWVDVARAPRSSGSTLKPLLYYVAQRDGLVLPDMLLPDMPMDFGGFAPKNFDASYSGAVEAHRAVALSLNIPCVYLLKEYGVARFASFLKEEGFSTSLRQRPRHYGLSLILGGAEISLRELAGTYARLAHQYVAASDSVDRIALYNTFVAMREIPRTDQLDWQRAVSSRQVAWKTGTSYGSRDAWAVGVTPDYVVAVWAGNADGSGVAGLTGAGVAGPVMFDLFDLLPATAWFDEPNTNEGAKISVCCHSGYRAGRFCPTTTEIRAPKSAAASPTCPYCRELQVSADGLREVLDQSEPTVPSKRFVLPSAMAHYYRQQHPEYFSLPQVGSDLSGRGGQLQITYPAEGAVVSLPRQLDGSQGGLVCKAVCGDPNTELFWHLDGNYIATTRDLHQITLHPAVGHHTLTVVAPSATTATTTFIVK